ncbi:MAG: hypothetical protein K6F88_01780 [Ruminococcus sp.]|nr:hypothetical protein [Ruminococcus sp.]
MKNLYKIPEIIVEELMKQDVLCASKEYDRLENRTVEDVWDTLEGFASIDLP